MDSIYVARVFAYETPSAEAKNRASVGVSVASKLNGNQFLVGTFVEGAKDERKVGFVTAPQKFGTLEQAEAHAAYLEKIFKRGSKLDPKEWEWGDEMVESSVATGANVYAVRYRGHDVSAEPTVIAQTIGASAPTP